MKKTETITKTSRKPKSTTATKRMIRWRLSQRRKYLLGRNEEREIKKEETRSRRE